MSFTFRPAKREGAPILFGVAGGTGSGKTMSGLRVATGLAGGERFAVIDTENGRALHYADDFEFDHGELKAPFTPARYGEAIAAADAKGYPVIMVDSASHEHAGDGGLLDMHDEEYARLGGRQEVNMAAWIKPKREHKRFVSQLLQVKAHVILCFRAEEKIDMVKVDGRLQVVPKASLTGLDGWIPVAEKTLPYELTASFLLTPDKPGFPKPIKLQEQHRPFVSLDQPLGEEVGARLGEWAAGGKKAGADRSSQRATDDGGDDGNAAALADELLALAETLGAREATEKAIASNWEGHSEEPAKHIAWLKRQIKTAKNNVEAKA